MQPFRGEGTNGAKQTQDKYCEKHSLMRVPAVKFSVCRLAVHRPSFSRGKSGLATIKSMHDSRCQDHLRDGVSKACDSRCLAEEVAPPNDPSPCGDMLWGNNVLRYVVHPASRWIGRHKFGDWFCVSKFDLQMVFSYTPELAIQYAMILPMSHAHTHVAGPPEVIGTPKVAGTDPSTPRIEIA